MSSYTNYANLLLYWECQKGPNYNPDRLQVLKITVTIMYMSRYCITTAIILNVWMGGEVQLAHAWMSEWVLLKMAEKVARREHEKHGISITEGFIW